MDKAKIITNVIRALVRPLVTLMVTGTFCWLSVDGVIHQDIFVPVLTMVVGFYFSSRANEKNKTEITNEVK